MGITYMYMLVLRHAFQQAFVCSELHATHWSIGFLLLLLYYIVDVLHIMKPFVLFQWMGMNTLAQGFYWRSPENNLVDVMGHLGVRPPRDILLVLGHWLPTHERRLLETVEPS